MVDFRDSHTDCSLFLQEDLSQHFKNLAKLGLSKLHSRYDEGGWPHSAVFAIMCVKFECIQPCADVMSWDACVCSCIVLLFPVSCTRARHSPVLGAREACCHDIRGRINTARPYSFCVPAAQPGSAGANFVAPCYFESDICPHKLRCVCCATLKSNTAVCSYPDFSCILLNNLPLLQACSKFNLTCFAASLWWMFLTATLTEFSLFLQEETLPTIVAQLWPLNVPQQAQVSRLCLQSCVEIECIHSCAAVMS